MNSFPEDLSSSHDLTDMHHCRFCNEKGSPLVLLCNCTSNVGFVHEKCALQWMSLRLEPHEGSNVQVPACQLCQCPLSAEVRVGKQVVNKQMLWYRIRQIGPLNAFLFLVILLGTILAPYLIGKSIIDILYHEVRDLIGTFLVQIVFPLHCLYFGAKLIYKSKCSSWRLRSCQKGLQNDIDQ